MSIVRVILFAALSFALWGQTAAPDELRYSPERMRMAIELRTRTETLHFVEAGWEIAILVLLLRLGIAPRMRRRGIGDIGVITAILAIVAAAELPASLYRHALSLRYGLSIQGWGSWLSDWAKATALAGVALALLVAAPAGAVPGVATRPSLFISAPAVGTSAPLLTGGPVASSVRNK